MIDLLIQTTTAILLSHSVYITAVLPSSNFTSISRADLSLLVSSTSFSFRTAAGISPSTNSYKTNIGLLHHNHKYFYCLAAS